MPRVVVASSSTAFPVISYQAYHVSPKFACKRSVPWRHNAPPPSSARCHTVRHPTNENNTNTGYHHTARAAAKSRARVMQPRAQCNPQKKAQRVKKHAPHGAPKVKTNSHYAEPHIAAHCLYLATNPTRGLPKPRPDTNVVGPIAHRALPCSRARAPSGAVYMLRRPPPPPRWPCHP